MKKRNKIIFYSVLILIVISLIFKSVYEINSLKRNGIYVIGRIDKVKGAYQGRRVYYSYFYKGLLYTNNLVTDQIHMNDVGRRFFFKIDSLHPNKIRIQYKVPVPDSLRESPFSGWNTLPVPF